MGEGREDLSEDDVGKAYGVSWKDQKANRGGSKARVSPEELVMGNEVERVQMTPKCLVTKI